MNRPEKENYKTGPAINEEEAQGMAALMRDSNWEYLETYLERIREASFKKHMRLDQGPETSGYYKGVWNLSNDLINLPQELGKQIFSQDKTEPETQGDLE